MKFHVQDLADMLSEFEEQNQEWLGNTKIEGWNLWFSIKKPLYYFLKNSGGKAASNGNQDQPAGRLSLITKSAVFVANLIKTCLSHRGEDVIITDPGNKLFQDENGRFVDPFVDPLILEGIISKYTYWETSANRNFLPARLKGLNIEAQNLPVYVIRRQAARDKTFQAHAKHLSNLLNAWFARREVSIKVSEAAILLLITNFIAQLRWYSFLWKIMRPSRIFTVDMVPNGSIAAGITRGVPVYEFQHGFVGVNKPDYIIPAWLKEHKNSVPAPSHICVFGGYFRDLILKSGFWKDDEVITLGSYVVDQGRMKMEQSGAQHLPVKILWTTQPSVFLQTSILLEELAASVPADVEFHLKFHPRESTENRRWYGDLCDRHAGIFKIEPAAGFFAALKGKSLVISFHSTTLLEALSVGCPAISIGTGNFKNGMNDLLDIDISDAIKPAEGVSDINKIINMFVQDRSFARQWTSRALEAGKYFFAAGYKQNLHKYFSRTTTS